MDKGYLHTWAWIPLMFSFSMGYAQTSVHASGGDASGTGGTVAYSIGQVAYTAVDNGTGSVSLGVQQPYIAMAVGNQEIDPALSVSVYPNPAHSNTFLHFDPKTLDTPIASYAYAIYDSYGRLLHQEKIVQATTNISLSEYLNAMYVVKVIRNQYTVRTFKVLKTN